MRSLAIVLALVRVAAADTAKPAAPAAPESTTADPLAEAAGHEANLESNAPRAGTTFSLAFGYSAAIGADGALGLGGAASARLGHVATPSTLITFELAGGSLLHDEFHQTLHNDDVNALIGGQVYTTPVLWLRAAGGFGVYTKRDVKEMNGPTLASAYPGPAGAVGIGVDVLRRHYFVAGFEAFSIAKLARDGLHTLTGICINLSYY